MSCRKINKDLSTLSRIRGLAKKAAMLDGVIYVIYKGNGEYKFARETDFEGVILEYIYP